MRLSFQPSIIHPYFFPQHSHPMEINFGDCFKWAWIAFKLFKNVELWSNEIHAFFKYKDKFYDSECLDGIKSWRRLRTIVSLPYSQAIRMSPSDFLAHWNTLNKCDWNALEAKINLFGQSLMDNRECFV